PSWPIEIPSLTAMVVNTRPTPLAAATPALACSESAGPVRLQGVTSLPAETTPTWGFAKSSPVRPTARSNALAPALAAPSVTSWERSLLLMRHDPKTAVWQLRPNGTQSSNGDDLLRQRHRPRSHPWPEGGDHRLRQPGACPRPQPRGVGCRRGGRSTRGIVEPSGRAGCGAPGPEPGRGSRVGRRDHDARPRSGRRRHLRRVDRATPRQGR